jgi:hypothetical protein
MMMLFMLYHDDVLEDCGLGAPTPLLCPSPLLAGAKSPAGEYLDRRFGGHNGRNPVKNGRFFCDRP